MEELQLEYFSFLLFLFLIFFLLMTLVGCLVEEVLSHSFETFFCLSLIEAFKAMSLRGAWVA